MRKHLIFILSFIALNYTISFGATYQISGKIKGDEELRYAYAFIASSRQFLAIEKIVANRFSFEGEIWQRDKFDDVQAIEIFLCKDSVSVDLIKEDALLSGRKHYNCTVIATDSVSLIYDTSKKIFFIDGGAPNAVQNLYENYLAQYRNSRDSLFTIIDARSVTAEEKKADKIKTQLSLYTKAMYGFVKVIKEYPDEVSLFNFNNIVFDQGVSTRDIEIAFDKFPKSLKNSTAGLRAYKILKDRIKGEELLKKPAYTVGMKFPDFILSDSKNAKVAKQSVLGKYTLIDFWATWCGPCRNETPNVIKAFNRFNPRGFKVVTISIDDSKDYKKWLTALKSDGMESFVNLFNGHDMSGLARELKVVAIPMNYLLDDKGTIVATNLRGEQLNKKLEELLSGSSN